MLTITLTKKRRQTRPLANHFDQRDVLDRCRSEDSKSTPVNIFTKHCNDLKLQLKSNSRFSAIDDADGQRVVPVSTNGIETISSLFPAEKPSNFWLI